MKIKRIDLFLPPESQYGVVSHFTEKLAEGLTNQGIKCRILKAEKRDPRPFLDALFRDPPDCTLSFNGLLPDEQGRFFCDMIETPHIACLTDSPNHFFALTKSPYTIIACVDRSFCDFFHSFQIDNVIFMPQGVEKELAMQEIDGKREYDVVMLSSFIDPDIIRKRWHVQYPHSVTKALEQAADVTLSDVSTSYLEAFGKAVEEQAKKGGDLDPKHLDYEALLSELESYIRGKDRIELLKSLKGMDVHVFGSQEGAGWEKYIGKNPHIKIHGAVPYEEALKIMHKSKILLSSTPSLKQGGHERIFAGLANGALVLSSENIWLEQHFMDESDILFYRHQHWDEANEKVLRYLRDEPHRRELVKRGRDKVLKEHTWDNRAQSLLQALGPILKNF